MNPGSPKPRLLFVSPRCLLPMNEGGKIRSGNILRGLKGGAFHVTLASPAPRDDAAATAGMMAICDEFVSWSSRPVSPARRALSLLSDVPVAVASDRSRPGSAAVARALAAKPDVVVFDFPHSAVLAPVRVDAASLLFTHNIEAEIFERHAVLAKGFWRAIWRSQSRKMDRFEGAALRRFDTAIAVSTRDAEGLTARFGLSAVRTIDTGVDLDYFAATPLDAAPDPGADGGTIVFVATMSWPANVEGIHFFLDEAWPALAAARPNIKAVIIGRDPPPSLTGKIARLGLNVTLTGFVDDIRPHVAEAHVYAVPLRVGSGTRIKVYEAMAMGRPLVSTALGVEGLAVTDGETFLRADTGPAFADAILKMLGDRGLRARLAASGRRLVEEHFSWSRVARQFEAICLQTMERRRAQT